MREASSTIIAFGEAQTAAFMSGRVGALWLTLSRFSFYTEGVARLKVYRNRMSGMYQDDARGWRERGAGVAEETSVCCGRSAASQFGQFGFHFSHARFCGLSRLSL